MFNIILFISTYPVLLIIYFVLKNNHKFHDHLLFSVSMKEEWVEQPEVQKIISEFHKQMNILLLIFFAIPLTSLLTSHFSIQFTIWMNWLMLLILLFYVPYAIANKNLKKWKKENQLYENQILVSYVEMKNAGNVRKVRFLPFFLPTFLSFFIFVLSIVFSALSEKTDFDSTISVLGIAAISLLYWIIALWMDRRPVEVICNDSDININYTRSKKNVWKNFWLACVWLNLAYTLITLLPLVSDAIRPGIFLVGSIAYALVLLILIIPLGKKFKNIEKRYASSFDPAFKTNEDEAWIFGLFYYNPKDKSSIVETRAGIGTSVNMATGLGKGLTIFSIIAMLSIPFISIFMIMEEFTPIHLVIKDDTLYCQHIFENYAIDTDTISNVSLVDELPSMVKSNGTAMDNLLKGKFHVRNQGNYELFLNPQHKYYINFSADEKNYYVNGFDDKETVEIYSELTD